MAHPMNYAQPTYGEWRQPKEMIRPVIVAVTVHYFHLTGKKCNFTPKIVASRCNILTMCMNVQRLLGIVMV